MEVTDLQPKMDFFGGVELLTTTKRDLITHTPPHTQTHTPTVTRILDLFLFSAKICVEMHLCVSHTLTRTHTHTHAK